MAWLAGDRRCRPDGDGERRLRDWLVVCGSRDGERALRCWVGAWVLTTSATGGGRDAKGSFSDLATRAARFLPTHSRPTRRWPLPRGRACRRESVALSSGVLLGTELARQVAASTGARIQPTH
jgi:hypothetical protein